MLPAYASVSDLQSHVQAAAEAEPATEEAAASFSYLPGPLAARAAIVEVDLVIPAGCTTALVGQSGSGKTTLADVVCGLLALTGGRVLLDGRPLEAGSARAWRSQVGYAIDRLHGAVTILVVAQRLATVRNADVICVLDRGRVVAQGTWDQLASDADGRFARLLSAQRLEGIGSQ